MFGCCQEFAVSDRKWPWDAVTKIFALCKKSMMHVISVQVGNRVLSPPRRFFALFERSITHIQNAFAFTLAIRRRIISETASHFTCWRENSATWFEWVNRLVISSNSQFLTLTVKWLTTSTFVHYFFVFFVLSIFTLISLNSPEHFVACPR